MDGETQQVKHPLLLIVSVMTATIMYSLDTSIVNIILPHLQGSLQTSQDQLAWVITSYIVVSAIVTPLLSPLVDRFGIARVLTVTTAMFTASSLLCGMATDLTQMVFFRMLQGVSGASLIPLSQSVLLNSFSRDQHPKVLSIWSFGVMIGPIMGPTLGGYLTELFNWRWVFWINLPIGLLALVGIVATVPRGKLSQPKPFDALGYILIAIAIGAFQLFLDRGHGEDWFESSEIIIEASLAALCLYMFVVHSKTAQNPFFSPEMFRDRNFLLGCVLMALLMMAMYSTLVLMPLFLQQLLNYPVVDAGILLIPRGIGVAIASIFVGKLSHRIQARYICLAGTVLMVIALHMMTEFNLYVSARVIFVSGLIQGMGLGLVTIPMMTMTFLTLNRKLHTEGTVFYSVARNIGTTIGVSAALTNLSRSTQQHQAELVQSVSLYDSDKWHMLHGLFGSHAEAVIAGEISRQASMLAYLADFNLMFLLSVATIPLLLLMRNNRYSKGP